MELDRKEMGRRISKRRKVLGIKQAVLAEKIGVNGNHLSSVETGKVTPSLELFVKICDELGVTPDYLLEGAMHSNNVPQSIVDHPSPLQRRRCGFGGRNCKTFGRPE